MQFRSGSYRARKLVGDKQETKTFDTAEDARMWLEQLKISIRKNEFEPKRELKAITFGQLFEQFLEFQGKNNSHSFYIKNSKLAKKYLIDITAKDVIEFRDGMTRAIKTDKARNVSPVYTKSTIVRKLNVISSVFSYATQELRLPIGENPAVSKHVKRPANADLKRTRRVSRDEQKRILRAFPLSERYVILVALHQGARQGEIFGLRWRDIDFDQRLMNLPRTKNEKYRVE